MPTEDRLPLRLWIQGDLGGMREQGGVTVGMNSSHS